MSRAATLSLLFLAGVGCSTGGPVEVDAPVTVSGPDHRGALQAHARARLDDTASTARFGLADRAWAPPPGATVPEAARAWVAHFAPSRGVAPAAVRALSERRRVPLREGGGVVTFGATVDGRVVLESEVTVLMDAAARPVAWSVARGFGPGLSATAREVGTLDATAALAVAIEDQYGMALPAGEIVQGPARRDGWEALALAGYAPEVWLSKPARLRAVWWPDGGELVPAWQIEVDGALDDEAAATLWEHVVDARDGTVLRRRSLTADATYRVWAEPSGWYAPADNPYEDLTPHPTGAPDEVEPTWGAPVLVTLDGFNTTEAGGSDPWLDADATESAGNNVDAYVDYDGTNGFTAGDFRADMTATGTFDRVYDGTLEPTDSEEQSKAAITQAFYTNNWLHDWYYDSGFTELAGNAQLSNYDRGGLDGDVLLVEVQDNAFSGARNNANMSTPSDGESPRMQAYLWDGPTDQLLAIDALAADTEFSNSSFGPQEYDLTGEVVAATTGAGDTLACEAITSDVAGRIALVDRGTCTFALKAEMAQDAGAVGLIVANDLDRFDLFTPGGTASGITIPVVGISYTDGLAIRDALDAGPVTADIYVETGPEADAALDTTVVAHEWGHYLHHRLASCGETQCRAMSEGWGDFVALHLALRDGDDTGGAYPVAAYAEVGGENDPTYYGIRRAPYSADPALNAFSFRHIARGEALPSTHPVLDDGDNAEVHNAGEIWAGALWQAYVALQDARDASESFDDARRRMSDIVVAGLALTPPDATYTEARDALLAAAWAIDPEDAAVLAEAFATRGMGSCAVAPDPDSSDLTGVVEDFSVAAAVTVSSPVFADGARSCDDDGILDGGEEGVVSVVVTNGGALDLVGATLVVATDLAGVGFPDGDTVAVPDLAPWESVEIALPVALDGSADAVSDLVLTATVTAADACVTEVSDVLGVFAEADLASGVAMSDTFDADDGSWTVEGDDAADVWARTSTEPVEFGWLGVDVSGVTDTRLVSPILEVSATEALVVRFDSRWSFETSGGVYWDGGVLEVRVPGGEWVDVSAYVDPGYGGTISNTADNPLSDRLAWVATNASWPASETITLDFGTSLAGSAVQLAFRIGTDQAASDFGWEIGEVAVSGVDNVPFPAMVEDADACDPGGDTGDTGAIDTGDTSGPDDTGDTGDTAADTGDTGSDTGDTAVDTGDTGSDTGDTAADTGDTGSDTGDTAVDTGDTGPDTGDTAADTGDTSDTDADTDTDADIDTDTDTDTDTLPDGDTGPDDSDDAAGCGCDTPSASAPMGLLGGLLLVAARRRRS